MFLRAILGTLLLALGTTCSALAEAATPSTSSAGDLSGKVAAPLNVISTDILRRYLEDLASRHRFKGPEASLLSRDELGGYFVGLMQQLSATPADQMSQQDYKDIGILTAEFEDTLQMLRGRMAMMLFRQGGQIAGNSDKASLAAKVEEHSNRLAVLDKLKFSGDFTWMPQSDYGRSVRNTMAANMRARLNMTAKVFEAPPNTVLGDAYFSGRLTAASGRFFPRNKYLLSPENGIVDAYASPFNSGFNEVQLPNLFINNNNSNSVRPAVSWEQAYYSQDLRFGSKWKGTYRLGLQNFGNYFDNNALANNETTQFINTSFVNSVSWRPNFVGPASIFALERPILRDRAFLRATAGIISLTSRDLWGAWGGNYELQFGHRFFNKEGNYRVGMWNYTFRAGSARPFVTPVDLSPSAPLSILPGGSTQQSEPIGMYMNFDQRIWKNIGLWGRYAMNDKQLGEVFLGGLLSSRQSWSTGIEIPVSLFSKRRPDDVIGIAYGQVSPYNRGAITPATPAFVSLNGIPATTLAQVNANLAAIDPGRSRRNEKVLEAYYRYQLNKNVSVSPDVQYYWSPGGTGPQPGIFVLGSRLNVVF